MTRRQRSLHFFIWCLLPVFLILALAAAVRARAGASSTPADVSLLSHTHP